MSAEETLTPIVDANFKSKKGFSVKHPMFEAKDDVSIERLSQYLLEWQALPEDMSLVWRGAIFRFETRKERMQFALGMQWTFDALNGIG